jgi:hypothetical protein
MHDIRADESVVRRSARLLGGAPGPTRRRIRWVGLVLLLFGGCGKSEQTRPLEILVSGDTQGWIVSCGCAAKQAGGLLRRADCVEQLRRRADLIVADVGGAAAGTSPYDRLRFEFIVRGEMAMGLAAHNIGAAEASMGPEYLRDVAQRLKVPFVSANVRDVQGRPVSPPLRVVEAGGSRVALIGVLGEQYASEPIQVLPPRQSVSAALAQLAASQGDAPDVVLVLAYMPEESLRKLAAMLPEVDAVVGGPTGQPLPQEHIGPVLMTSATNKGKFLARLTCEPKGRWNGTVVELSDSFADNTRQVANLNQFYHELAARDFTPPETGFVDPLVSVSSDWRAGGSSRCGKCHEQEFHVWQASKHAHAWPSLERKGAHVDPECQRCHTTAYGAPGGFVSVAGAPETRHVGCESCHGPSEPHATDASVRTAWSAVAADRCIDCHDRENSPHFHFENYWDQIRHGGKRPSTEAGL